MAELILKHANPTTRFGCYSERGVMSYFMFVVLPTQVGDFLADLRFPAGVTPPFADLKGKHPPAIIFSELNFGNEGFGCPDGALFVECPLPTMVFVEVKLNEGYAASCRGGAYNSTIRGQLELRWRMTELHRTKRHCTYGGNAYVQETPEFKAVYKTDDASFYGAEHRQDENWPGSWRRLKIDGGVKDFLGYLQRCEDRVYFCATTKDPTNPFDSEQTSKPRTGALGWDESKKQFCWLPVTSILNAHPQTPVEVAAHV